MNRKKHKTEKALIAYFDILGYQEIVKTNYVPESILIERIELITKQVHESRKFSNRVSKWKVYSFSDNFAIVINSIEAGLVLDLKELVSVLILIQYEFLAVYGFFIRGSITSGNVYVGNKFIYGEGLIKAYEIENSIAIYPRIVVDLDLINDCFQHIHRIISKSVSLNGKMYDPKDVKISNLFQFYTKLVIGFLYNEGRVDSKQIDELLKKYEDDDLITLHKDFDDQYYIDCFQSLLFYYRHLDLYDGGESMQSSRYFNFINDEEEDSILDQYVQLFLYNLTGYIITFGKNDKLLKKYLWVCHKANNTLNKIGYCNLISKSFIFEVCDLDLNCVRSDDDILNMFIRDLPE
ncbi:MAG: hypothetical protein J1F42_01630 [Lachnospiraceae bacterium]|nr:hypothetical protein [Lachnospiraceae bacterium]